MNLDRLPEIVEALGVTMNFGPSTQRLDRIPHVVYPSLHTYEWTEQGSERKRSHECLPPDAANACVVEMLRRLTKNTTLVRMNDEAISILPQAFGEWARFPGDLLTALYDAFTAHPEWFKEPTNG